MTGVLHITYGDHTDARAGRWAAYIAFTAAVGLLLLLNWQGVFKTIYGIDTAILLALIGGYRIFYNSISALFERRITAEIAIMIAIVAALAIGEYLAAAEAVLIMLIGEGLEEYASRRTRSAIEKLTALAPARATVRDGDGEREVAIDEVRPGDIVIVRPGGRVPVDGEIAAGRSSINEAPITGESIPADKGPGDVVYAGSVNQAGALEIRTTGVGADTTLARIISLIEEAEHSKAPAVRLADRYARYFLPALIVIAAATWYFTGEVVRTVSVLLVACPCALILATPAAVVAAIGRLAREGVLVKSGAALEAVSSVDLMVFDKTGTITEGHPVITRLTPVEPASEIDLLRAAAVAEQRSEHIIAQLILREARERGIPFGPAEDFKFDPGLGVEARTNGHSIVVGNRRLIEARDIPIGDRAAGLIAQLEGEGHSNVLVAENGALRGIISVRDSIRASSRETVHRLRHSGISRMVMLTGDREAVARAIARQSGLDEAHSELLPQHKVELIEKYRRGGHRVAMVGDGINDAPALAAADVGIAMGVSGTDIAIEEADVVLMNDRLERLPFLIDISRATLRIIGQNIWGFAFGVNIASILAASFGIIGPAGAAAAHQVSALLVVLNSLRLLAYGRLSSSRAGAGIARIRHEIAHFLEHHLPGAGLQGLIGETTHALGHWYEDHRGLLARRAMLLLALAYVLSGIVLVGPDEIAVVKRFGRRMAAPLDPGLHYRLPWPIDRIARLKPRQVKVVELGFRTLPSGRAGLNAQGAEPAAYEWNLQHRGGRYEKRADESLMLTGDENLIEVNAVVQYSIRSPEKFLFSSTDPDNLVRVSAESGLRNLIGQASLESVLTTDREKIQQRLSEQLQLTVDGYQSGIGIVSVQLQDVHPSIEVVDAFRNVSSAFEDKSRLVNEAEGYRNEQLALAAGQALARIAEATGYTSDRSNRARGDADRFNQAVEAFKLSPNVTETRLYLETIEQVLAGKKKMIIDSSKFGKRQVLFVDPQGTIVDPAKIAGQAGNQ